MEHAAAANSISRLELRKSNNRAVYSSLDPAQIPEISALAREHIGPEIAAPEVFERVLNHNHECSWVVYRREIGDPFSHRLVGFTVFLVLNAAGHGAVRVDKFVGRSPDLVMLCRPGEPAYALYSWASVAPGLSARVLPKVVASLAHSRFSKLDIYTRPGTVHGARILATIGFEPALPHLRGAVGELLVMRRSLETRLAS
jgi:hypothetical protein